MKFTSAVLLACLAIFTSPRVFAGHQEVAASDGVRLVLVLNVDAMIPEQLDRMGPWWKGGFRRLLDRGTRFVDAHLPYANTESAVGHASFGTGVYPSKHGITRDALIDPATGELVPSVLDAAARTVSSYDSVATEGSGASGSRLQRQGWAGTLRKKWPGSRSLSISGKGSSACLLGGRSTELALWWDSHGRGFVSSSAYAEELPAWLAEWNRTWPAGVQGWDWQAALPEGAAQFGTAPDERPGEAWVAGRPPVFPYPAPKRQRAAGPMGRVALAGHVFATPLMDRVICEVAMLAVRNQGLGADDEVDLLAISLSACDLLAKATGPYSVEVTDALMRADEELGKLFEFLDATVGESRWMVVMGSDRGLLDLPEGRLSNNPGGVRIRVRARRLALNLLRNALLKEFGEDFAVNMTGAADAVTFGVNKLPDSPADATKVRALAARVLKGLPWVAGAYTRDELLRPARAQEDPWLVLERNSFRAPGGVEVAVRLAHRHLLGQRTGTQSGSPYPYDRRQSLIFMGPGFPRGSRAGNASSIDALPTVLGRLGVALDPDLDGRDLLR